MSLNVRFEKFQLSRECIRFVRKCIVFLVQIMLSLFCGLILLMICSPVAYFNIRSATKNIGYDANAFPHNGFYLHYVRFTNENQSTVMTFIEYLSAISAIQRLKPDRIMVHGNTEPTGKYNFIKKQDRHRQIKGGLRKLNDVSLLGLML